MDSFMQISSNVQQNKNENSKSIKPEELAQLKYYNIRGLCQPIRNLLYYMKVDFKDAKVDPSQAKKEQKEADNLFNSGLPNFRDQACRVSNSIAIANYICTKYNRKQLLGRNIRMRAKINQIIYKYSLQMNKIMSSIMDIIIKSSSLQKIQKQIFIRQMLKKLLHQSKFLSYCFKQHKRTNRWILEELSILDFYYYQTCFYICGFFTSFIVTSEQFRRFITYFELFNTLQLQERARHNHVNLFLPFKNKKIEQLIVQNWQGDKNQQIF